MTPSFSYKIRIASTKEYPEIIAVWEASVRATHDFLSEEDMQFFKPLLLNELLDAVQLHCIKINDKVAGFLGTSTTKIEMLFVHPEYHGKGIGKQLLLYAIHQLQKKEVDVNEQNAQAVGFYKHLGFVVRSRSERDGMDKPYPILHMFIPE
jgi:putative acetyltransferase